jgi:hypothetical protein
VTTAPQVWNPVARQVAIARGLGTSQTARLLALLNLAGGNVDAEVFAEALRLADPALGRA